MLTAIFTVIATILFVIAEWNIFTKAGEAGWKSLIPLYNIYTQFKFTWKTDKFFLMLVFSVLLAIGTSIGDTAGTVLTAVGGIGAFVFAVLGMYYLAKSFGRGIGFTLGLIFLPNIFTLILGLGNSRYIGNGYELARQ